MKVNIGFVVYIIHPSDPFLFRGFFRDPYSPSIFIVYPKMMMCIAGVFEFSSGKISGSSNNA